MKKLFNLLDKFSNKMSSAALAMIVAIGLGMLLLTVVSVFFRYVLNASLTWSEEILKMALVWFGLLSVGVIALKRQHVGIVVFKERMPAKVQVVFDLISQILLLTISVILCVIGVLFTIRSGRQLTPALRIPYAYGYLGIPVSFMFMVVYELRNTAFVICNLKENMHDAGKPKEEAITEGDSE